MIYLASPYSHTDLMVRDMRVHAACAAAAKMFRRGLHVFSPIAYAHAIAEHGTPREWDFWELFDCKVLAMCSEVWVLALHGWEESRGVQAEIFIARELGKPVKLLDPETLQVVKELTR